MPHRFLMIVLAASLSGCVTHAPRLMVSPSEAVATAGAKPTAASTYDAPVIEAAAAYERVKAGDVVIVDVRDAQAYRQGHIEGAVNVPWADLDVRHGELPANKDLLLYCTCPGEHSSAGAADDLHDMYGYQRLFVLKGGMDAWRAAGYPMAPAGATP